MTGALSASLTAKEKEQLENLEKDWHNEIARPWKRAHQMGRLELPVEKKEIKVTQFALAWVPFWDAPAGGAAISAYR